MEDSRPPGRRTSLRWGSPWRCRRVLAVIARRLGGAAPTVIAWLLAGMLLANEFTYWSIRIGQIGLDD